MKSEDALDSSAVVAVIIVVSMVSALFTSVAQALSPKWTGWEQANSVAKYGQWLVIRQPNEGFCYVKQTYDRHSDNMDLLMKLDNVPVLINAFHLGIQGDVSYRVDDGPLRIVPEKKAAALAIKLSPDVVPEMKRGSMLVVRVKPVGSSTVEQKFDLRGFTAASKRLDSEVCRMNVPDQYKE